MKQLLLLGFLVMVVVHHGGFGGSKMVSQFSPMVVEKLVKERLWWLADGRGADRVMVVSERRDGGY